MRTIRNYSNSVEAGFAQSLLEASGIDAVLLDENAAASGVIFTMWSIRLQVPDGDVTRALEILDRKSDVDDGIAS
jgi:hypothetical protein